MLTRSKGKRVFCQHFFQKFPEQEKIKRPMLTDFAVFANSVNIAFFGEAHRKHCRKRTLHFSQKIIQPSRSSFSFLSLRRSSAGRAAICRASRRPRIQIPNRSEPSVNKRSRIVSRSVHAEDKDKRAQPKIGSPSERKRLLI